MLSARERQVQDAANSERSDQPTAAVDWPKWVGYVLTLALELALTAALLSLDQVLPIGNYPISYILVMMLVAYFFGEGPASLAFFLGLGLFTYYFVPPTRAFGPVLESPDSLAKLLAFLLGTTVVGFTAVLIRRHSRALRRLTLQLSAARNVAQERWSELEAILSSTPNAVIVIDSNQNVVYCNPAVARLVPVERTVGQSISEWLQAGNVRHSDGRPMLAEEHPLVVALRGVPVTDKLLLVQGESGPDTLLSATSAPIRDSHGGITGSVVIYRNVTLQHSLQQEVERQRSLMDAFMQNVPVGMVFRDTEGRVVIANRALAELNQVPLEDMLGKRPEDYLPPALAANVNEAIRSVFATGEPIYWRDAPVSLHGDRYLDVSFHAVRDHAGEITGIGTVVVDTTEQVRARRSLQDVYERERKIAETLQSTLLGDIPKRINGFEFEKIYRAALDEATVGGDFYDIFTITHNKIGVVIGDVSGKGLSAAVHVALAKYTIRGRAYEDAGPAKVMEHVNEALVREMDPENFMTVFFGILDCEKRTLTYANCGQAPAMLWKAGDGRVQNLPPTCPVAGSLTGVQFNEVTLPLNQGDELLLGTDGIFEIRRGTGMLGLDALQDIYLELKRSGAASAVEVFDKAVEASDGELRDDVAILRVTAAVSPADEEAAWSSQL